MSNHPQNITGGNFKDGSGDHFVYPTGITASGPTEYPHYIRFIAKRSYTSTNSTRGTQNGDVVLYMPPDALKTSYSQTIGDIDARASIALHQAQGSGIGSALTGGNFGTAAESIEAAFSGAKDNLNVDALKATIKTLGKTGAAAALTSLAGTDVGQAVSRATGQILNPHKAVVYQGPGGFRTFSYTFVMVPKDVKEAEQIFKIVKFFKRRMHPGTGAGTGINSTSSVALTYPDEFEIKYYVNRKEVDGSDVTKPLFKIHNCFMESFNADYTTSGLTSFMDDAHPLTTTISMSFKETQLLTKKDIDEGY
jgi:hypothetical protein